MSAPRKGAVQLWSVGRGVLYASTAFLASPLPTDVEPPTPAAPVNLVAPSISGTPEVGAQLARVAGSWSGYPSPNVTWQWTADAVDIAGETGNTLILQAAHEGAMIGGYETATNSEGSAQASSSNTLGPVTQPVVLSPPVNTMAPSVMGSPTVGAQLMRMAGTWSGNPAPTVTWQWTADGVDIAGATADTLNLEASQEGAMIGGYETATNSEGSDVANSSNTLGPVVPAASSELILNGTFDTDMSNWTPNANADLSAVAGWGRVTSDGSPAFMWQAITTEAGKTYRIQGEWRSSGGTWRLIVGSSAGGSLDLYDPGGAASGTVDATFVATGTTTYVSLRSVVITAGDYGEVDNVSVQEEEVISAPTYTVTSAPGEVPEIDLAWGPDIQPGWTLRIQRTDVSMVGMPEMGDYTTPTVDVAHIMTLMEIANGEIDNAALGADGYPDPSGEYWQRYRFEHSDGSDGVVASPWSAELHDTILTSSATMVPTTGVDKSMYLDMSDASNLAGEVNANVNSRAGARATIPAQNDKFHMELVINGLDTGVFFGIIDAYNGTDPVDTGTNLQETLSAAPGSGAGTNGFAITANAGLATVTIARNNTNQGYATPGGALVAVGDALIIEADRATNTVDFYYRPAATGVTTLLESITLTSKIPTEWFAYQGGLRKRTSTQDMFTVNYGGEPFLMTPTAGYDIYG